jgi:hypothetical protein
LSTYVASQCLAVVPQSGATQNFYCTVYYITLNSNYEAQRAAELLKQNVEDRVRSQKIMHKQFECIFLVFKGEKYV